jgi:hypothetical protein
MCRLVGTSARSPPRPAHRCPSSPRSTP